MKLSVIITLFLIFISCDNPANSESSNGTVKLSGWAQVEGGPVHFSVIITVNEDEISSWNAKIKADCGSKEFTTSISGGVMNANTSTKKSYVFSTSGYMCQSLTVTSYNLD